MGNPLFAGQAMRLIVLEPGEYRPPWMPSVERLSLGALQTIAENFKQRVPVYRGPKSEAKPRIAVDGEPAIAWIVDLVVSGNALDANFQFVTVGDRDAVVMAGKQWIAPVIEIDSVDPKSGAAIGPRLVELRFVKESAAWPGCQPLDLLRLMTSKGKDGTMKLESLAALMPRYEKPNRNSAQVAIACCRENVAGAAEQTDAQLLAARGGIAHELIEHVNFVRLQKASQQGRAYLKIDRQPVAAGPAQPAPAASAASGREVIDVSGYPGRNRTERIVSYVAATHPKLSYDARHAHAWHLDRVCTVKG